MEKTIRVSLNEEDILRILKCDFTNYNYDSTNEDARGFLGVKIDYFYRQKDETKITEREAKKIIYSYLLENNIIDKDYKRFSEKLTASHRFSSQDEQGCSYSIWNCNYSIEKEISLKNI